MALKLFDIDPRSQLEYLSVLVDCAQKARYEGLLALEEDLETFPFFMKMVIQLIVDGTEDNLVRAICMSKADTIISYIGKQLDIVKAGAVCFYRSESYDSAQLTMKSLLIHPLNEDEEMCVCLNLIEGLFENACLNCDGEDLTITLALFCEYVNSVKDSKIPGDQFELLLSNQLDSLLKQLEKTLHSIVIGGLAIQSGDNPRIVDEKLKSLTFSPWTEIPQNISGIRYKEVVETEDDEGAEDNMLSQEEIDSLLQGDFGLSKNKSYLQMKYIPLFIIIFLLFKIAFF